MHRTQLTLSAAAAVGCALVFTPAVANAAPAHPPVLSVAVRSAQAGQVVTGWTQTPFDTGARTGLQLRIAVSQPAHISLTNAAGEQVGSAFATPDSAGFFLVTPNGDAGETLTATVTVDGAATQTTDIPVDYTGVALSAPRNVDTDAQTSRTAAEVRAGKVDQVIRYQGIPGATVTVVSGGGARQAVAGADGIAVVPVRLQVGATTLTVSQRFGDRTSNQSATDYHVYPSSGDETPAYRTFAVDQADGADLETPVFSGTGTPGGLVSVTEHGRILAGVRVPEDGTWELRPTLDTGRHELVFEFRTGYAAAPEQIERSVTVG